MAVKNQVVVHFLSGKTMKGTTEDFYPNRQSFHLTPTDGSRPVTVECKQLKAVYFVKSLVKGTRVPRSPGFTSDGNEAVHGKKIAVRFKDRELLCGYTLSYDPGREGFFMTPAGRIGNNLRVYVVNSSILEARTGKEAEDLARKLLATQEA